MTQPVTEAASIAATTPARDGGARYRARLIEGDRQGSSGYYSRDVLERDGAATWPSGTHVFMDHPGEQERHDRPERSVRDLAGRIDSTPVYESDGLYADVYLYPWAAGIVREMADDIGMSIRAAATVEASNDPAVRGPLITSLTEGVSVDLVTRAGAGGRLVQLLESARRDPAVHVVTEATSLDATDIPAVTPADLTEAGPIDVPAPAGQSTATESQETNMATTQIEEAALASLRSDAERVPTLESERDTATARADAAEARVAAFERAATITTVIESVDGHDVLNALERAGLAAGFDGDEDVLRTAVEAAVTERAATTTADAPFGFGATVTVNDGDPIKLAEAAAAEAFGRITKEA